MHQKTVSTQEYNTSKTEKHHFLGRYFIEKFSAKFVVCIGSPIRLQSLFLRIESIDQSIVTRIAHVKLCKQ